MDELIKQLRSYEKWAEKRPLEIPILLPVYLRKAADELEKRRWIPNVTLPEKNGHYLVVLRRYGFVDDIKLNDKNVKMLRFHDGQWRLPVHIPEWINETLKQEVTRWMELPELPEEDET